MLQHLSTLMRLAIVDHTFIAASLHRTPARLIATLRDRSASRSLREADRGPTPFSRSPAAAIEVDGQPLANLAGPGCNAAVSNSAGIYKSTADRPLPAVSPSMSGPFSDPPTSTYALASYLCAANIRLETPSAIRGSSLSWRPLGSM